jgi:hypothetical protein
MDVCVHVGSNRRCLVVAVADQTAVCVDDDDRAFVCRVSELVSCERPDFEEALRRARREAG